MLKSLFEGDFKLFENPLFTGLLGVIIGAIVSIVTTYLNNKNQKEIVKLNITYKYRLQIISKFLLTLINIRHSLEPFVYCDLDISNIKHDLKRLLELKQRLVQIRFAEIDLYKNNKKDLEELYYLINYLLDIANAYTQIPWEEDIETDEQIIKKMEYFIKLAKRIEEKFFIAKLD